MIGAISPADTGLVNTFNDRLLHRAERTHLGHAVPIIRSAWRTPHSFVTFEKPRHKEFFRECR